MGKKKIPCKRHPDEFAITRCQECRAPMCRECRNEFGYFCSAECRDTHLANAPAPEPAAIKEDKRQARAQAERWLHLIMKRIFPAIGGIVVLWLAVWLINPAGKEQWRFKPDVDSQLSALAMDATTVYTGGENKILYALDKKTGAKRWAFTANGPLHQYAPILNEENNCVVVCDRNTVYVVDRQTGEVRGKHQLTGKIERPVLMGKDYLLATATSYRGPTAEEAQEMAEAASDSLFGSVDRDIKFPDKTTFLGVRLNDGKKLWEKVKDATTWQSVVPFVQKNVAYWVLMPETEIPTKDGKEDAKKAKPATGARLLAVSLDSGKVLWAKPYTQRYVSIEAAMENGLVVRSPGRISMLSYEKKPVWEKKHTGSIEIAGNTIVFGKPQGFTCLKPSTGEELWSAGSGELFGGGAGKVFACGYIEREMSAAQKDMMAVPKTMHGVDLHEVLEIEEGEDKGDTDDNATVSIAMMQVLDANSGETYWEAENLDGEILPGEDLLICLRSKEIFRLVDQVSDKTTDMIAYTADSGVEAWSYRHEGHISHMLRDSENVYAYVHGARQGVAMGIGGPEAPQYNAIIAVSLGW